VFLFFSAEKRGRQCFVFVFVFSCLANWQHTFSGVVRNQVRRGRGIEGAYQIAQVRWWSRVRSKSKHTQRRRGTRLCKPDPLAHCATKPAHPSAVLAGTWQPRLPPPPPTASAFAKKPTPGNQEKRPRVLWFVDPFSSALRKGVSSTGPLGFQRIWFFKPRRRRRRRGGPLEWGSWALLGLQF
jgi:hypothetical protein